MFALSALCRVLCHAVCVGSFQRITYFILLLLLFPLLCRVSGFSLCPPPPLSALRSPLSALRVLLPGLARPPLLADDAAARHSGGLLHLPRLQVLPHRRQHGGRGPRRERGGVQCARLGTLHVSAQVRLRVKRVKMGIGVSFHIFLTEFTVL
jgi:hypothetical protein